MDYPIIPKPPVDQFKVRPNLDDYDKIRAGFHLPGRDRRSSTGCRGGAPEHRLRVRSTATSTHGRGEQARAGSGRGRTARRSATPTPTRRGCRTSSRTCSARWAIAKGERVFCFMDRVPELLRRRLRHAEGRVRHRPALLRLRAGRRRGPPRGRRGEGARHVAGAAGEGRADAARPARARAHHHRRARQGARARAGRALVERG